MQKMARLAGAAAQRAAFGRFAEEAATLGVTSAQAMMTGLPAAEVAPLLANQELPVRFRLIDFR